MITRADLRKTAREYLTAAVILRDNGKSDVSVYLCGYAVEIALKDRICRTLRWPGFPDTKKESEGLSSFRVHNLEILLRLSGAEGKIKPALNGDWSTVTQWNPEERYRPRGTKTPADASDMIAAAESILKVIL
jgi:hypothetical protein